jgi:hypothetical protein
MPPEGIPESEGLRFKLGNIVRAPAGHYREKPERTTGLDGAEHVWPAQPAEGWRVIDIFPHHRTGKTRIVLESPDGTSRFQLSPEELETANLKE